jgi:hypothetical protein
VELPVEAEPAEGSAAEPARWSAKVEVTSAEVEVTSAVGGSAGIEAAAGVPSRRRASMQALYVTR